jgi:hypothetical protein
VLPLSADNVVHENSGYTVRPGGSTTITVSLAGGDSTTAGNKALIFITSPTGLTVPTGWTADRAVGTALWAVQSPELTAGETSWTFTCSALGVDTGFSWYVAELSNIDLVEPLDASAVSDVAPQTVADGGTLSTGTTPLNAALDTVVFAVFMAGTTNADPWSFYTNDFGEVVDVQAPVGATLSGYNLAVARKFVTGSTGQFSSTATLTTTGGSVTAAALVVAYRAADSPIVAPLAHFVGFGQGTHGGINATTGVNSLMGQGLAHTGTWGSSYLIEPGGRNSSYRLKIVQAGAGSAVRTGSVSSPSGSIGFDVQIVSATGTVVVASIATSGGATLARLEYDSAASKFGVRCGTTGTVSWQAGTTATNTWVWIDLRLKVNTSTWRAEWRLETGVGAYTEQAAAELGGQSPNTIATLAMGSAIAQTVTSYFSNVCLSNYYVAYPLGPHQIRLLTVDSAGTPTVSGTSTNFSRFTANGTLAAINAATAALLVDEVPPTVSASADGVCQTAVAASDYIEFPMAPCTLAADEVVVGVRMLAAMWDGTGTGTGTIGIRGWDGTTETTLIAASVSFDAGSPTAVSSTEPYWQTAMWPSPNGWTQAELDALALRFGFSTDATPDKGTDALYLEYAIRKATTTTVIGEAGGVALESNVNPNTTGVRSLVTTTPSDQGTTLNWTDAGGPHTQAVAASSTDTQTLDAGAGEVTDMEVVSGNEAPDRE